MIQNMMLRARVNSQRHYELYAIDCDNSIDKTDIEQMFETDPQSAADLFRSRGHRLYSDRAEKNRVKIT
jgi:hypothetical protein